eukprot:CAMPEP_0119139972 /NCGR_PEP_ID=MMETSP1310-20130426/28450_1 /TAXON_ID=464262 /ORGANISM="Genus nov. species nov., Strain RCC2339" /LENGTH=486 /DNA_ID=CAMNT_0007131299 /DNA_START=163 /DNA_END=1623 /DNA_ORIENTATION=+
MSKPVLPPKQGDSDAAQHNPFARLPQADSHAAEGGMAPGVRQTGVFSAANVVKAEMLDIVDEASEYRDFVKGMQGRKITEEDSDWLKERKENIESRLHFVHEMLTQCQEEMAPAEFADVSANFQMLCAQLQAMFKVATKRERKRYTVTQEVGQMDGMAMDGASIAQQLEAEAAAMEGEQQQMQEQKYELNIDPRWSMAHPLLKGGKLMEYTDEDLMQEREQELLLIQQEAEELAQMMEKQNEELAQQEEKVEVLEVNTIEAQENVDEGVQHILKAAKGRKYKMVAGGGLVAGAAIGAGAGVAAGPAGIIVGAAIGAGVGFGLGYGGAKLMRHRRDLNQFKLYLDKKWVSDKDVNECMDCRRPFTTKRRKHHCRYCGNIFCSKCSAKKIKLPKVDWKRPERVCNACFTTILEINYEDRKTTTESMMDYVAEEPAPPLYAQGGTAGGQSAPAAYGGGGGTSYGGGDGGVSYGGTAYGGGAQGQSDGIL